MCVLGGKVTNSGDSHAAQIEFATITTDNTVATIVRIVASGTILLRQIVTPALVRMTTSSPNNKFVVVDSSSVYVKLTTESFDECGIEFAISKAKLIA